MSRRFSFRFWGLVPAVLPHTTCGSSMSRCGMSRCVPARGCSASRCVAGSGVPHAGAGSGPWGLAAFRAARGFIPSAVRGCVCRGVSRGVSRSLQGSKNYITNINKKNLLLHNSCSLLLILLKLCYSKYLQEINMTLSHSKTLTH